MGKVGSFTIAGVDCCWFYSHEHRPPHFHARRKGRWHVRVFFQMPESDMIEPIWSHAGRMTRADRNALCEMAARHRAQLLEEWEEKVRCDD
jgi:hypothetical protein